MPHFPAVSAHLGDLQRAVEARLDAMDRERWNRRLWARDHTLWKPDPTEITDRLGWLEAPEWAAARLQELEQLGSQASSEGIRDVILLGMGGSSLAPEVIASTFGSAQGYPRLHVLDTTDPATILALERSVSLDETLFVVASKSGGTIETLSQFAYFYEKRPDGNRFVAITDGGSGLERLAAEKGFRRIFVNPPDIGGRYSALSYFGMVPAALTGAPLGTLVDEAREMAAACSAEAPSGENPGARLGAVLGEAARDCRDKLTLLSEGPLAGFGAWVEQLVAESTGKEGQGILPVVGEPEGEQQIYGPDRLLVTLGQETALRPALTIPVRSPEQLGAEFFRWEYATAIAGAILGIQPFDQPNVQEAKDATNRILAGGPVPPIEEEDDLGGLLNTVLPGDYIAITAFVGRTPENDGLFQALRVRLRDRYGVATTVGFGPRFLHSTGQLHKGGPDNGVFIQVVEQDAEDVPIPGKPYTFGMLKAAQALGDYESLRARGRRVARVCLSTLLHEEVV